MRRVEFSLSLEPVAKGRPRVMVNRKTGKPIVYTPRKTARFEARVSAIAQQHFPTPFKGAVSVKLRLLMPRPKRLMRVKDPEGEVPHVVRPDLDNLEKTVIDGLNGVAFVDDKQVFSKRSVKMYHAKNGFPQVTVVLESEEVEG